MPSPSPSLRLAAILASCLAVVACATAPAPTVAPAEVGEIRAGSGYLKGYLDRKLLPDSLALLPPPPAEGSAAAAADLQAYRSTRALRDTPRWRFANQDAELKFPAAAETFSCAMNLPISAEATPHLNMLLRRTLADAGLSTYGAKDHYKRTRPFAALKETTCKPSDEASLSGDGSYPSGHAALGWAWALVLAEVSPERADAVLGRGYEFGQSRVICGVHWQSDVDAGRVMGAAAIARVRSDPVFVAQLDAARREVVAARAAGRVSTGICQAETAAFRR